MVLKGRISFDKKNLPPYVFKYNVALIGFFIGWFVLCLPPIIAVAVHFGESFTTYAVMIALFGLFAVGFIIYYIIAMCLRKRLVNECAAKLEEEFKDMSLEEARAALKENSARALEDKVYRSYGILKYARNMSSAEAKSLLSDVMLGNNMGILPTAGKLSPLECMVMTEPALICGGEELKPEDRDRKRAEFIREHI